MRFAMLAACVAVLSGCGGGSGENREQALVAGTTWAAGTTLNYQETYSVSGNNTVNLSVRWIRGATGSDGSYDVTRRESDSVITVSGLSFGGRESVDHFNAQHQQVGMVVTYPNALVQTCNYSPARAGLPRPLLLDSTWRGDWTQTCTPGRASSWQLRNGHVVGLETVTVPAGTYRAVHVVQDLESTSAAVPYTLQQAINIWIDTATGLDVKQDTVYSYTNGTPGTGYLTHSVRQLASVQPGV